MLRRRRTREKTSADARIYGAAWDVPERFNFTRDVVEALGADPMRRAITFVDREGIVDRRTFAEIARDAARWAHLLRSRIRSPGERVLVMVGKTPSWHGIMLGALKGGLVTIPCSEMLRSHDLAFRVGHSGARLVVADRSCEAEVTAMLELVERQPEVVYVDAAKPELALHAVTAPTENTRAGDPAFILYTSGTTKEPKGVTHTHAYTWAKRAQAEHWLDARPGDLVWCTAGTGWAKSIWNVLLGPWSQGAEVLLHDGGFEPEERLALLQRLGVTVLCQAPTEYRLLAKHDALDAARLPRLRHAVSAGEPLNAEVVTRFRETLGVSVHDGYGQTENTLLVANLPGTPIRPGSMGLPTPGHDVGVIDQRGHIAPAGEEGDIALLGRPPTLFAGYWDAPEETDAVFRDGWYITGDRAIRDEEGYLWFTGRADDVILSAAYRIGPFEVESALLEHPAVAESAVVGKPDADRGEIVKAFVVLRGGAAPGDALVTELQEHVKSVTAPYKYPREIEFVEELPKTRSGKIRRVELRERERAAAPAATAAAGARHGGAPDIETSQRREAREERERRLEEARARAQDYVRRLAAEMAPAGEGEPQERSGAAQAELERSEQEERAGAEQERERAEAQLRLDDARRRAAEEETERERAEAERREALRRANEERSAAREAEDRLRQEEKEERRRADEQEKAARVAAREAARQQKRDDQETRRLADDEQRRAEAEAREATARLRSEEAESARVVEAERQRLEQEVEREQIRRDAEEQREAARLQELEAVETARREDEERARREAEERLQREADEAHARAEAEALHQREADEARARAEAEALHQREAEEREAAERAARAARRAEAEKLEAARRPEEESERQRRLEDEAERQRAEEAARSSAAVPARGSGRRERGGLFRRHSEPHPDDVVEGQDAPIPDLVERLRRYSGLDDAEPLPPESGE